MKRLAALAVMLALVLTTSLTWGQTAARRPMTVGFRHGLAALLFGMQDSASVTHTGAITDTTQPFVLEGRAFVPYVLGADSLSHFDAAFTLSNGTALTAAADSLYITLQGSFDGVTWDSAPQVAILEGGNGSGLYFYKGFATTRLGVVTPAAATNLQMGAFPFLRFITQTSAADKGVLKCNVYFWKQLNSPQW